jgi:hypothetical protein
MKTSRLWNLVLLGALALAPTACEDMPAGPDALEAITESGGVGGTGLSLRDLFAAAMFQLQREEGQDTAVAVLRRWREARENQPEDHLQALEAATVVRAFGPGVVDRASAVVSGELSEATLTSGRILAKDGRDPGELTRALDSASVALGAARTVQRDEPELALIALQAAADQLARVRVALVDAERFPTLEELYRSALDAAGEQYTRARGDEARLVADVERASSDGNIERRYSALEALRNHRAQFTVQVLGPDAGRNLLAEIASGIAEMRPLLDSLDRSGTDVIRDRRMLEAAAAIRDRGEAALHNSDPVLALDLATHAAGVLDELRRRRVR